MDAKNKTEFRAARHGDEIIVVDQILAGVEDYRPRLRSVYPDAIERWSVIDGSDTAMRWSDMTRIPLSEMPQGARAALVGASS